MARDPRRRASSAAIRLAGACLAVVLALATIAVIPTTLRGGEAYLLNVLVAGGGTVVVQGPGGTQVCDPSNTPSLTDEQGCEVLALAPGSSVILTAVPGPGSTFSGWSRAECQGTGPCALTLDQRAEIVAIFSPLELHVIVDGAGTVVPSPAPTADCAPQGDAELCWAYPAGTDVSLTATPAAAGDAIEWDPLSWCEPDGGDLSQPVCRATVSFRPQYVMVRFAGGPEGIGFPFQITKQVRILKAGSGSGVVRGAGFDCGAICTESFLYGKRPTVQAVPDPGSRFVRWQKTCSTQPSCTFSVGQTTSLTAIFDRATPPPPPRLSARIAGASVKRKPRLVILKVTVSTAARARVRLLRGSRRIAARTLALRRGTTTIRLKVPARAKAGRYRVVIVVTTPSGQSRTLRRSVRIPARRG